MINLVTQLLKAEQVKVVLAASAEGFSGGSQVVLMILEIFSLASLVGGARRNPNAPRQGDDLLHRIRISFEESVLVRKTIKLRKDVECDHCHGTGAKDSLHL